MNSRMENLKEKLHNFILYIEQILSQKNNTENNGDTSKQHHCVYSNMAEDKRPILLTYVANLIYEKLPLIRKDILVKIKIDDDESLIENFMKRRKDADVCLFYSAYLQNLIQPFGAYFDIAELYSDPSLWLEKSFNEESLMKIACYIDLFYYLIIS